MIFLYSGIEIKNYMNQFERVEHTNKSEVIL